MSDMTKYASNWVNGFQMADSDDGVIPWTALASSQSKKKESCPGNYLYEKNGELIWLGDHKC